MGRWPAVSLALACGTLLLACSGGSDDDASAIVESPVTPGTFDVAVTTAPAASSAPHSEPSAPDTEPSTTAPPGEPLLAGLELVRVLAPAPSGVGLVPEFAWDPVDGAATYRLVVLGPDGPLWAWEGPETSVWLGGFDVAPPPGATRLAIVDETCWSVVARDESRTVIAASPLLPVSPTGEPSHSCDPTA